MSSDEKPRIVIDTNVWISGLVFGGPPGAVLELFIERAVSVAVSEELLSELRRKIARKFPLYLSHLHLLEASIAKDAAVVRLGVATVNASRDPDDNQVLETALAGGCQYVVSGDKDLLTLQNYGEVRIVTPAQFLHLLA